MSLRQELDREVAKILADHWSEREGRVVPESDDLALTNDAVTLDGTVLYADLSESTALVDSYVHKFAAEIYKTYLHCAAKIIKSEGGAITAYDGDRVMAIFLGNTKNTSAARTGLKLNWAVRNIINPKIQSQYPNATYRIKQTVGIDTSALTVARTGVRGANDLVFVGRAANHAAKLTSLPPTHATRITKAVYDVLYEPLKRTNGKDMWELVTWNAMDKAPIYRSAWEWRVD
jgi:class 3 adenylate cyclase